MGIKVNLFGTQQSGANRPKRFDSPFDRAHSEYKNVSPKGAGNVPIINVKKDGVFQIGDILDLGQAAPYSIQSLEPLQKFEGQRWSPEIFNETTKYFLDNIKKLNLDKEDELGGTIRIAELLDKVCYKAKDLSQENRTKIIDTAGEYGWALPKSLRKHLNPEQKKAFDNLANEFKNSGQDAYADEVKKITDTGEIKYEKE